MDRRSAVRKILRRFTGYDVIRVWHNSIYDEDGLRTNHNHEFVGDPRFAAAYKRGISGTPGQASYPGPWRIHIALWAAQTAFRSGGDFVECGVHLGFTSSVIMTYMNWNAKAGTRKFYLVDNFEGIVPDLLTDEEIRLGRAEQYGTKYSGTYERAKKNVLEFKNIELVKGTVPAILGDVHAKRISFLHLDMNSSIPEVSALRCFWDRLVPGAVVLLDDYAYSGFEPQKRAIDDLGAEIGFSVVSLPTGQGLVIR